MSDKRQIFNEMQALPVSIDAEKVVLGAILLDDQQYPAVADVLKADDFALQQHQRIFSAMGTLHAKGLRLDYVTITNELQDRGEREACGGLEYLISLNDTLPKIANLESYVRIMQEKSLRRRGVFAAQNLMNRFMGSDESSVELLVACQKTLDTLSDGLEKSQEWTTSYDVIKNYPGGPHQFIARPMGGIGLATPWPNITETLGGGLHKGELFILAGRPSMGKSVIAMQIGHHMAIHGHDSVYFSLEMSEAELTGRRLCGVAKIDHQRWRSGHLNMTELDKMRCAAADLEGLPPQIDCSRANSVPAITAILRKIMAKHSIEIVIIDHLQLMKSMGREQSRHHELSSICHELKHLAVKLDVCIVLLSQLNRECELENRRPQLSDLKETGSLEEDGDVVLFVHRPERYMKNRGKEELRGIAEFIIAKQRSGPIGLADMVFLPKFQWFECKTNAQEEVCPQINSLR